MSSHVITSAMKSISLYTVIIALSTLGYKWKYNGRILAITTPLLIKTIKTFVKEYDFRRQEQFIMKIQLLLSDRFYQAILDQTLVQQNVHPVTKLFGATVNS